MKKKEQVFYTLKNYISYKKVIVSKMKETIYDTDELLNVTSIKFLKIINYYY